MIIDVHIIQNLAPSNVNRDDQGQPKQAMFGGYLRARVSSQSWKRAVRDSFAKDNLIAPERRAVRSELIALELRDKFVAQGKDSIESLEVAIALLSGMGFSQNSKATKELPRTQYLLFLGQKEIGRLAEVALFHWDALIKPAGDAAAKKGLENVRAAALEVMDGGGAVDLALFGRMLANLPEKDRDGAVQVAHAISTHEVEVEWDYFTAVEDLHKFRHDSGAAMINTIYYDSATLYRYTNLDMRMLVSNLNGDRELAIAAVRAYLRAFLCSIPSGKQASFGAQNQPAFAFAVVRKFGRWSLANAFVNPAKPGQKGIVASSITALVSHWKQMVRMYGGEGLEGKYAVALGEYTELLDGSDIGNSASIEEWIEQIVFVLEMNHERW